MSKKLLNSAMMPTPGTYRLEQMSRFDFAEVISYYADEMESFIGYEQTADHIEAISGYRPAISRRQATVQDGDTLLICRLRYRVADPDTKGRPVDEGDFEYFVCRYSEPD